MFLKFLKILYQHKNNMTRVCVCVCLCVCVSRSVISHSLKPHERQPAKVKVAQSSPTLCNPMYYMVHGILQARILE